MGRAAGLAGVIMPITLNNGIGLPSGGHVPIVNLIQNPEFDDPDLTMWYFNNVAELIVDSSADPGSDSPGASLDCLRCTATDASSRYARHDMDTRIGENYFFEFYYFVPAGDPDLYIQSGGQPLSLQIVEGDLTTKDAWTFVRAEFVSNQATGNNPALIGQHDTGGAIGDLFYFDAAIMGQLQ